MAEAIWKGARVALGVGLAVVLVVGPPDRPGIGQPAIVTATTSPAEVVRLTSDAVAEITYADSVPPDRRVSTLLAGAAEAGADVTLTVPGEGIDLWVEPPRAPVARRKASLTVTLRGQPGADVPVIVAGRTGPADSVSVPVGPSGWTSAAIAVEPGRAGASSWTVRAGGVEVTTHARVRPEAPVRVLVSTGAPTTESRYLVRALEAAGARVSVHQDLGRDRFVVTDVALSPERLEDLERYDVVALVGPGAESLDGLVRRWVAERGGGLLLVGGGDRDAVLRPWAPRGPTVVRPATAIRWSGPAEIVPLPGATVTTRAASVPPPDAGVAVAWSGESATEPDGVHASASWLGRGRIFASGFETWPWVLEAGLAAEHAAYWESVVEWLAGGLSADVSLVAGPGRPWVRWEGRLEGDVPDAVTLTRPPRRSLAEGSEAQAERLEVLPTLGMGGAAATVRFVPLDEGGHGLSLDPSGPHGSDAAELGVVVIGSDDRPPWTVAALEIGAAGGRIRTATDGGVQPAGRPPQPPRTLRWLAFLSLATLAVAGWVVRRVEGRP